MLIKDFLTTKLKDNLYDTDLILKNIIKVNGNSNSYEEIIDIKEIEYMEKDITKKRFFSIKHIRFIFASIAIILILSIAAFFLPGKYSIIPSEINYGTSVKFNEKEISDAFDIVLDSFKNSENTRLIKLYYDEEKSNIDIKSYMTYGKGKTNGIKEENIIILLSDFYCSLWHPTHADMTLTDYKWILIRDSKDGEWRIDGSGY